MILTDCCSKANKDLGLWLSQIKAQAAEAKTLLQVSRLFNGLDKRKHSHIIKLGERFSLSAFQQAPFPLVKVSMKQLKDIVQKWFLESGADPSD